MSTGIWAAAAGAVNQATALDITSNNVANAATPGYKADRAMFREYLSKASGTNLPSQSFRYTEIGGREADFKTGWLKQTGRDLDLAIMDDNAFMVVDSPAGPRYTRAGSLKLSGSGALQTHDGLAVLGPGGKPIRIDSGGKDVSFSPTGDVLVDGEPMARIAFVKFAPNPGAALEKEGSTLFRARGGVVPKPVTPLIEPKALEMANKSPVEAMSGLSGSARQFEFLSKVIETFSTIDKRAASDIAKK